jgi:hypothetical protein
MLPVVRLAFFRDLLSRAGSSGVASRPVRVVQAGSPHATHAVNDWIHVIHKM